MSKENRVEWQIGFRVDCLLKACIKTWLNSRLKWRLTYEEGKTEEIGNNGQLRIGFFFIILLVGEWHS